MGLAGVLGFLVALFLAWLRLLEWRAKPDLRLDMDWIVGGGGPATLRIVAENRGKARGGIRNVVFSRGANHDPQTAFIYFQHGDELPVPLDPGAFARFTVELDPNGTQTFTQALLGGSLTHAILIDQDNAPHPFEIPKQPEDQKNRVSGMGRVAKR